jgi:hypothetical protein
MTRCATLYAPLAAPRFAGAPARRSLWLAALALVGTAGCSGAETHAVVADKDALPAAFTATCKPAIAKRAADIAAKSYVPVTLGVHAWPGREAGDTLSWMPETEFAAALRQGPADGRSLRTTLVLARGGTGKSRLAESLYAQMCNEVPVFRIDLNLDIAGKPAPEGVNPIAQQMVTQLGLSAAGGPEQALKLALGDRPFVVLLDSLDEVQLMQRQSVAMAIDELLMRLFPNGRAVVMSRPPVFNSNYGIGSVDARVEIPQLSCEESDTAVARIAGSPEALADVQAFVTRYQLGRKVTQGERCTYPHLATYRDIEVVIKLAKNTKASAGSSDFKDFQNSRAQVYTYFASAQLLRDMQTIPLQPAEAIAVVDAMVAVKSPDKGERNLGFRVEDCINAGTMIEEMTRRHGVCERLLQSSVFKAQGTSNEFHFANQSLGDLFLARWAANALMPAGKDGKPAAKADCGQVAAKSSLMESNEVAGFLLGQPAGQQCAIEIAATMCKGGGHPDHLYQQFEQGLPDGAPRVTLLEQALADLQDTGRGKDACVAGLFERLVKPLEAKIKRPAAPAAAPASKGKGGRPPKAK